MNENDAPDTMTLYHVQMESREHIISFGIATDSYDAVDIAKAHLRKAVGDEAEGFSMVRLAWARCPIPFSQLSADRIPPVVTDPLASIPAELPAGGYSSIGYPNYPPGSKIVVECRLVAGPPIPGLEIL